MGHSLIWDSTNQFIKDFLPVQFIQPDIATIYSGGVYSHAVFSIKNYSDYELGDLLQKHEEADNNIDKLTRDNSLRRMLLEDRQTQINKLLNYEQKTFELISRYGLVLDDDIVLCLNKSSHTVKKHFNIFLSKVDRPEDLERTYLHHILPSLLELAITTRTLLIEKADKEKSVAKSAKRIVQFMKEKWG